MNGFGDPRIYQYFKNTEEYGRRSVVGCRAGANVTNKDLAMKNILLPILRKTQGECG